ncbi:MAG: Efflux ABC transporter, permease/ATP-binding protein, partial [uncultured Rubrobacteraceae bacterium]
KGVHVEVLEGSDHLRPPGPDALPGDGRRQYLLRQTGREPGGDRGGGGVGRRGRLRPRDARRLRHDALRAWREPVGGAAPAHLHSEGDAQGYPDPDPGRAPGWPGRRSCERRRGELAGAHGGQDHLRHRPRAQAGPERGPDPGPRRGQRRRVRHPRGTRPLWRPLRQAPLPPGTRPRPTL